jgi:hypothetical protein
MYSKMVFEDAIEDKNGNICGTAHCLLGSIGTFFHKEFGKVPDEPFYVGKDWHLYWGLTKKRLGLTCYEADMLFDDEFAAGDINDRAKVVQQIIARKEKARRTIAVEHVDLVPQKGKQKALPR